MKRHVGRPMKYKYILYELDEHTAYTPASIALFAEENGLLRSRGRDAQRIEKNRIRIAMGRFSNNHGFPDEGDSIVFVRGRAPCPGWFGWRWREAIIT
jgi:hypothetical protein